MALTKGQNAPLTAERIRITVETAASGDLSALLVGSTGKVRADADFVFYNQPTAPGVAWQQPGGAGQHLDVDLTTLPSDVDRVLAVVSLDDRTFGTLAAPVARVLDSSRTELHSFEISGLGDERAVIAWELYRRAGAWKVRAVGQGYPGGLAQLVMAYGVTVDDAAESRAAATAQAPTAQAATAQPAAAAAPARASSVPPGTIPEMTIRPPSVPIDGPMVPPTSHVTAGERMFDVIWKIFEDAARATAALRSATRFADQRRDGELSALLDDPRARNSPQTDAARATAERRYADLVARATADFTRDSGVLVNELAELSGRMPAAMAAWDSPTWNSWRPVDEPQVAMRLGDLHVGEAPDLRIPMVVRLPLRTPLWIDSAEGRRTEATAVASSLVVRMLSAYPPGRLKVHIADLVGGAAMAKALEPLTHGVVFPTATTPAELSAMLARLSERVDLVQMAAEAGALETLEGKIDEARQLLVLHDFPFGFNDQAIAHLRFLMEDGPSAGVHLLFVADRSDSSELGPLVSSLWRSMLRLSAEPDDHIGDPWVEITWTYSPDAAVGAPALASVLTRLADANP